MSRGGFEIIASGTFHCSSQWLGLNGEKRGLETRGELRIGDVYFWRVESGQRERWGYREKRNYEGGKGGIKGEGETLWEKLKQSREKERERKGGEM